MWWILIVLLRRFDGAGKGIISAMNGAKGSCDGLHIGLDSWL